MRIIALSRSLVVVIVFLLIDVTKLYATGPLLTPTPRPPTTSVCQKWAEAQDEDAIDIWGVKDSGAHSKILALSRLTDFCLGHRRPEIVGFGTSAGFDDMYCAKHAGAEICRAREMAPRTKNVPSMTLGKSDRYAGCVFSIAIPLMHNNVSQDKASEVALKRCEKFAASLEETEIEGVSDYINLILNKISAK